MNKIIDLLEKAEIEIASAIEWAKYPKGAEEHGNKSLEYIHQVVILLKQQPKAGEPKCNTCGDTGHNPARSITEPCPDCQQPIAGSLKSK